MSMYAFVLQASNPAALQASCDAQLNVPMGQPGRFKVLAPFVILSVTSMDAVSSTLPPFAEQGSLAEREAMFWIAITDTKAPELQPLSFHIPYTFLDNPLALAAGREIYGFPKDPADIVMPPDASTSSNFVVNALTIAAFSSTATVTRAPLVQVTPPSAPNPGGIITDGKEAFEALKKAVDDLGDIGHDLHEAMEMLVSLEHHYMQTILLKQMRDITNGLLACYQAVIQAPMEVTRFEALRLLDPHTVTLQSTASHPLPESLGLAPTQTSLFSFWLQFDSCLPDGEVLWQAGT
jgi:hypothetical protein